MYGILLDGQLIYAKEYFVCEDGSIINFNNNITIINTIQENK